MIVLREAATALFNGPLRNLWPMVLIPLGLSLLRDAQIRRPAETRSILAAHKVFVGMPGLLALILASYAVLDYLIPGKQDHNSWVWLIAPALGATILCFGSARLIARTRLLRSILMLGRPASGFILEIGAELGIPVRELEFDRPVCFVTGLRKPVVFVSTFVSSTLTREELRAVLLHERAHARSSDTLWIFVLALLHDGNLFRGGQAFGHLVAGLERLADLAAIRECRPTDLASAIVRIGRGAMLPAVALQVADRSHLGWRLNLLLSDESASTPSRWGAALSTGVAFASLGWPVVQFALCEIFCRGNG